MEDKDNRDYGQNSQNPQQQQSVGNHTKTEMQHPDSHRSPEDDRGNSSADSKTQEYKPTGSISGSGFESGTNPDRYENLGNASDSGNAQQQEDEDSEVRTPGL